jgi:malonyl-CoA decarboxylase
VVQKLSTEFEEIKHFATLSPVPGFRKWLSLKLTYGEEEVLQAREIGILKKQFASQDVGPKLDEILDSEWSKSEEITEIVKPILLRLCAQYLLEEKRGNMALDPVANFHLANGARLERINWLADLSASGMERSYGIMVNYLYKLSDIEKNHEEYVSKDQIIASRSVRSLLK